jgi:RND superfamily putative drug exporter
LNQPRNLAARAGRWSATHRKSAIFGWLLFVVLATVIGGSVGQKNLEASAMGNGESKRGELIVDKANYPDQIGEQVLVQGKNGMKADDPQITAAVQDVVRRLDGIKGVTDIESPLNAADKASTVSKDGRSVVVNFKLPGKFDDTDALEQVANAPLAAVAAVQKAHPELRVEEYGAASEQNALGPQERQDENRSMQFSMGGALIILLLAFGALVAAGVPLLLGLTAVAATTGLLGPVSQLAPLHEAVAQVVMLVGLAVGVDYAMFYLRRMMEEQDKGRSSEAALDVAAATSGRAVLISGFTVMAAMAGMFFSGNPIFVSFGIGTIIVVGVAVLGSLTVLPATLSYLGQKGWLEKGRVPWVAKRRHKTGGESRMWGAILDRVLARPLVSVIVAGGLLVALALPALNLQFKEPGTDGISRSQPIMRTLDRIDEAFPGGSVPATVVVKAKDVTTPEVQSAITQLHDKAIATGELSDPSAWTSARTRRSRWCRWPSRAAAPTPPPTGRSRSCARTSCRPPSGS